MISVTTISIMNIPRKNGNISSLIKSSKNLLKPLKIDIYS